MWRGDNPFWKVKDGSFKYAVSIHLLTQYTWNEMRRHTLVLASRGAPLSSSSSTAVSCPLRAAQWSGVRPSCTRRTHKLKISSWGINTSAAVCERSASSKQHVSHQRQSEEWCKSLWKCVNHSPKSSIRQLSRFILDRSPAVHRTTYRPRQPLTPTGNLYCPVSLTTCLQTVGGNWRMRRQPT